MSEVIATVYDPPEDGQPYLAIIFMNGKVIFAEAVPSVKVGESLLRHMLACIAKEAKSQGFT